MRADRRQLRFRLAVLGTTVGDVVDSAGGWICDRAMAGWDVTVATTDAGEDARPLRMLGAVGIDLGCALNLRGRGPWPHALALSTDVYAQHQSVREGVRSALERGYPLITMWGDVAPAVGQLVGTTRVVEHRISTGAQRFKRRALDVVSAAVACRPVEVFRSGEVNVLTSWPVDLEPVLSTSWSKPRRPETRSVGDACDSHGA